MNDKMPDNHPLQVLHDEILEIAEEVLSFLMCLWWWIPTGKGPSCTRTGNLKKWFLNLKTGAAGPPAEIVRGAPGDFHRVGAPHGCSVSGSQQKGHSAEVHPFWFMKFYSVAPCPWLLIGRVDFSGFFPQFSTNKLSQVCDRGADRGEWRERSYKKSGGTCHSIFKRVGAAESSSTWVGPEIQDWQGVEGKSGEGETARSSGR